MMSANEKAEMLRELRTEIRSAMMSIILNGQTRGAAKNTEGIDALLPGYPGIVDRPLIEPYGFHSQAPDGTLSISLRCGDHPGSRYVSGHRDANRPDLATGESVLYNQFGQQIRMENGVIKIGSPAANTENFVLGQVTKQLLSDLLQLLSTHTHITSAPGAPTSPPIQAAQFVELKASPVDNEAMLSDYIFGEKEPA